MKPKYKVMHDALPGDLYDGMKAALPTMDQVPGVVRSHKDLAQDDPGFRSLMQNPYWVLFMEKYVRSPKWWGVMLLGVGYDAKDLAAPSVLDFRDFSEPRSGLFDIDPLFLYPRVDIGYGTKGYGLENGGKGIHIDMPKRILSIMLYFTDQSEIEGGEFEVYAKDDGPESYGSGFRMIERVPIRENMMIATLQDANGWHAVNPVTKANEPRIAAYIALSSSKPLWLTR